MSQDDAPEAIVWQGKFITAKTRGKWEYVSRARGIKAAVILAMRGWAQRWPPLLPANWKNKPAIVRRGSR